MTPELARAVHQRLLEYYGAPVWRNPLPPIEELISTILSQNTNDANRDRAFLTLKERFSNWEAVRDADPQAVSDAICTAGLANQKGKRIQTILHKITRFTQNDDIEDAFDLGFLKSFAVEDARQWLMQFKGVGPKTAAIVLLFSLGIPAFPVDTHIYRVSGRVGLRPSSISVEETHRHLESIFPPKTYAPVHLNLIRLGREKCKARKTLCPECPLQELCTYVKSR